MEDNMPGGALLKEEVSARLKGAIFSGRLKPGERVVENHWARQFGVAQASVREAINLLMAEGLLEKAAGRSARVTRYTAEHVARIYQVRGALEGLAAQLAAESGADLSELELALARMEAAAHRNHVKDLVEGDLAFHLALASASGNVVLIEALNRILRPLFGFVLLRMMETRETAIGWEPDLPRHRRMIDLIRDSDPSVARQYVEHCVGRFITSAHRVWWPETQKKQRRLPRG